MPRTERNVRANLANRVAGLEQVRGRLLSNRKSYGRARADAERRLARAEAVGDDSEAGRLHDVLAGLLQNERRVEMALTENKRALEDAQRALSDHVCRAQDARAMESAEGAIALARAANDEIMAVLRERVEPKARAVIAAVNAAITDEQELARIENRVARVHPAILDRVAREAPGAFGRVRALLAILDDEVLALPTPADGYTMRPRWEGLRRLNG